MRKIEQEFWVKVFLIEFDAAKDCILPNGICAGALAQTEADNALSAFRATLNLPQRSKYP
jgi:hypothetical protein